MTSLDSRTTSRPVTSRRAFVGGAAAIAGGALADRTASAQTPIAMEPLEVQPEVDVTLLTSADPGSVGLVSVMPTAEEQASSPRLQAYAEVLQMWLDANPGVTIEQITLDSTNPQALVTAIAGGTAPSWYGAFALGGGLADNLNAAFQQGFMADITALVEKYNVSDSISDTARQLWEPYRVGGAIYSLPGDILFSGTGMFYRIDLFQEAGLEEPTPDWTWEDVRTMAAALTSGDRRGIGLENWAIGLALNAQAYDLLTKLPAPDQGWNWRWDFTSQADKWAGIIQNYRDMIYTDGSAYVDITVDMPQVADAFAQGTVAMAPLNSAFMNPVGASGIPTMPETFGLPFEELVGFTALPVGPDGHFGASQPFITNILYNPDLDEVALDKAVSLYTWLWYGDGYRRWLQRVWELSQDPAQVYVAYAPVNGITQIEGVPASISDVWPTNFLAATEQMNQIPLVPQEPQYIPPEPEVGPTGTASSDAQSRWTFEPGELDLAADLQQLEDNRNAEAAGFESGVPDEEFVAGAQAYYDAHRAFWEEHAPDFSANEFEPWYEANVAPVLST